MLPRIPYLVGALVGWVCIANACQVDKSGYTFDPHSGGAGSGGAAGAGGSGEGRGEAGSSGEAGGSGEMGGSAGSPGSAGEGATAPGGAGAGTSTGGTTQAGATGEGGAPSGGSAGEGQGGGGGAGGATIDCGQDTVCGASCAVLASDAANCGACGHDCGVGASCTGGVCGPASLTATAQSVVGGVAVDASGIYFGDGTKIVTCPLDGCTLSPKQIWSATYVRQISAGQGNVAWQGQTDVGRTAINKCAVASCTPATVASGDAVNTVDSPKIVGKSLLYHQNAYGVPAYVADHINCSALATGGCAGMTSYVGKAPFATDGTALAFFPTAMNAPTNFVACPLSAAACTQISLAPTSGVIAAAAAQNIFYMAWSGMVGANPTRMIQSCSLAGCTTATKITNTPTSETVVDVVADSSGVYWAYGGDTGSIWMCPAGGCVGGARQIAAMQANPFSLQLYGNFVYWGAQGLTANASAAGSFGLRRVAKPLIQ